MTTVLEALHMGLDHHMAGRLNEAKEVYERILDADPQQPSAHHLLGLIAAQAGDVEHGITLIQKAIQLDASNSDFHANLGTLLLKEGRPSQAVAPLRTALTLNPSDTAVQEKLWTALRAPKSRAAASIIAPQVVAELPERADTLYNCAEILFGTCDYRGAAHALKRALDLGPPTPGGYDDLGYALQCCGMLDEAKAAYRQALALDPNSPKALFNLGAMLCESGGTDQLAAAYGGLVGRLSAEPVRTTADLSLSPRQMAAMYLRSVRNLPTNVIFNNQDHSGASGIVPILQLYCQELGYQMIYPHEFGAFARAIGQDTPILFWSHEPISRFHPLLDLPDWRLVHMHRDPRDSALSLFFDPVSGLSTLEEAIANQAMSVQASCEAAHDPRVAVVTFEEMKRDTVAVMRRILDFTGLPPLADDDGLRARCDQFSFEKVTGRPRGEQGPTVRNSLMYRSGVSGGWRTQYSPQHRRFAKRMLGAALIMLGYEKDMNW